MERVHSRYGKEVRAACLVILVALGVNHQCQEHFKDLSSDRMDPHLHRNLWSEDALHCLGQPAQVASGAAHLSQPDELKLPFYHYFLFLVQELALPQEPPGVPPYLRAPRGASYPPLHV